MRASRCWQAGSAEEAAAAADHVVLPEAWDDKLEEMMRFAASSRPRKTSRRNMAPEKAAYLRSWMLSAEHIAHPYPTEEVRRVMPVAASRVT